MPGTDHDESVRAAGDEHLEDFGEGEQLAADLIHAVAAA
jgi:hypothetical protein